MELVNNMGFGTCDDCGECTSCTPSKGCSECHPIVGISPYTEVNALAPNMR